MEDGFQFPITGEFGARYQVEQTDYLEDWTPLAMVTNIFGTSLFDDATATNSGVRVYRAVLPP